MGTWDRMCVCVCVCVCVRRSMTDLPGGQGYFEGHRGSRHGNTSPVSSVIIVGPLKAWYVIACEFMFFEAHNINEVPVVIP